MILAYPSKLCEVASGLSDSVNPRACSHQLLCPRGSPGKIRGVGRHAHLQGFFWIQGLNPRLFRLQHWQVGSLPSAPPVNP